MYCSFCQKAFNNIVNWAIHIDYELSIIESANPSGPYRCPSCFNEYERLYNLGFHLKNNKCNSYDDNQFKCERCASTFSTEINLFRHIHFSVCVKKRNDQIFQCSNCFSRFTIAANLRKHKKMNICESRLSLVDLKVRADLEKLGDKPTTRLSRTINIDKTNHIPPTIPQDIIMDPFVKQEATMNASTNISASDMKEIVAILDNSNTNSDEILSEPLCLGKQPNENRFQHLIELYDDTRACPYCYKILCNKDSWVYHVANSVCIKGVDKKINNKRIHQMYESLNQCCPLCNKAFSTKKCWIYHVVNSVC